MALIFRSCQQLNTAKAKMIIWKYNSHHTSISHLTGIMDVTKSPLPMELPNINALCTIVVCSSPWHSQYPGSGVSVLQVTWAPLERWVGAPRVAEAVGPCLLSRLVIHSRNTHAVHPLGLATPVCMRVRGREREREKREINPKSKKEGWCPQLFTQPKYFCKYSARNSIQVRFCHL